MLDELLFVERKVIIYFKIYLLKTIKSKEKTKKKTI